MRALSRAPWSASKVAMALRCPRLSHFKYVEKVKELEVMPEARIGKAVHAALENALQGVATATAISEAGAVLEAEAERRRFDELCAGVQPFVERIAAFRQQRRVQRQLVEYALAIREDGSATKFYSGDAFYRGILDAGFVFATSGGDTTVALVDHKTGVRPIGSTLNDQMEGYAVLSAATFPQASTFWLGVHWLTSRAVEWSQPVTAAEVQQRLVPLLLDNIEAAALAVDDGPRTNPSSWCDRCSYRAICPAGQETAFHEEYDADED